MNERPITVLITCIGSQMGVELIRALSDHCTLHTRVVGVEPIPPALTAVAAQAAHSRRLVST